MNTSLAKQAGVSTGSVTTPVGFLNIVADDTGVKAVTFADKPIPDNHNDVSHQCMQQLLEYIAGKRQSFDLLLSAQGSEFQHRVWQQLLKVKYGEISTYLSIAKRIGNPSASRAVGMANGKNPLSIIVPCHRIIGSSGKLTGYAGGLHRKTYLLDLEAKHL